MGLRADGWVQKYMPQEVAAAVEKNRAAIKEAENEVGAETEGGAVLLSGKSGAAQPTYKPSKLSKVGQARTQPADYKIQ